MPLGYPLTYMVRTDLRMSTRAFLAGCLVALCLLAGCQTADTVVKDQPVERGTAIVETMDAGGYTYVKLGSDQSSAWYAVPQCEVAVGDRVEVTGDAMAMKNFKSPTLKRTFASIYFASGVEKVQ